MVSKLKNYVVLYLFRTSVCVPQIQKKKSIDLQLLQDLFPLNTTGLKHLPAYSIVVDHQIQHIPTSVVWEVR